MSPAELPQNELSSACAPVNCANATQQAGLGETVQATHLDGHQRSVPHPTVHFAKGATPHQGPQPHVLKGQRILTTARMRYPAGSKQA